MTIKKILIADDEPLIRGFLHDTLKGKYFDISLAADGESACSLLKKETFDIIITDLKMPKKSGIDVLRYAKKIDPNIFVIIMTAYGSIENAVEAMKLGAFHYLIKPFSPEAIEAILEKVIQHDVIIKENRYLREKTNSSIIAHSPQMKKIMGYAKKIATSNASVFISGESGTGKEVIAQAIHTYSPRSCHPFIRVNCAALPETLLESEFFGHEKGSFTGANTKREGRFELAHLGSLLLDEITEIPLSLQPKLLRAIQEKEFERVGGNISLSVDIRFIATSNRNMQEAISSNLFRKDLFYRLNVLPIHLPPLRERKEDILPLAQYFLYRFCRENHKAIKSFSTNAKEKLLSYPWPGNVRELANVIERCVVLDFSTLIEKEHLLGDIISLSQEKENSFSSSFLSVGSTLAQTEKKLILATLKAKNNNKTLTAKTLGIHLRTLRNKLKEFEKEKSIQEQLF